MGKLSSFIIIIIDIIYVSSTLYILIEFTTFYQCNTTNTSVNYGNGAALYIECGNIVLNQVCGYQCQSSYCGFSYIQANSNNNDVNTVIETSVSNCNAQSYYTMCNVYGFINISTVNLSFNEVTNSNSALHCQPSTTSSNGFGTSITYSSFADNTAGSNYCLYLSMLILQMQTNIQSITQISSGTKEIKQ